MTLPLELGQVTDPTARRALEQIALRWPNTSGGSAPIGPPPLVSALPSSPVDGQEIYFQNAALAALDLIWHFRYRAAATTAYKWEFLGGSEWSSADYVNRSVFNTANLTTFVDLAQGGVPAPFTVPLAGHYKITGLLIAATTAANSFFEVAPTINGALYSNNRARVGGAALQWTIPIDGPPLAYGAGDTVGLCGSTNNVAVNFAFLRSRFFVIPVRVG